MPPRLRSLILGSVALAATAVAGIWLSTGLPREQVMGVPPAGAPADQPASSSDVPSNSAATPTLEELQKIRWRSRPCIDFFEHLRKARAAEVSALSEAEALRLRNDGPEANAKILAALGRLPTSDDEVDWDATFQRFLGGDPVTLNPLIQQTQYEAWVNDLLFNVFPIGPDWNLDHYGDLDVIESWET